MDKPQHSKLSQAFVQAAEQDAQSCPLPEQLWQTIAQELSEDSPVDSSQLISEAFEKQELTENLPVSLWDNIASKLEENKIKESFENQANPIVPAAVWSDIKQQLEVESIWNKVQKALEKRTKRLYWWKKIFQASLVLLLLLWLRGCSGEQVPSSPIAGNSSKGIISQPSIENTNLAIIDAEKKLNSNNTIATKKRQKLAVEVATEKPSTTSNTTVIPVNKNIQKQPKLSSKTFLTASHGDKNKFIPFESQVDQENKKPTKQQKLRAVVAPSTEIAFLKKPLAKSFDTPLTAIVENNTENFSSPSTLHANVPVLARPKQILNTSVLALEAIGLKRVEQQRQRQKHRVELGLQGRVKGTVLLGKMTSEAMEHNSMTKTKIFPTVGAGVNLAWYITGKNALIVSLYPVSNSHQYFGGYTKKGRYYHKEIKLSYFDTELAYQYTLFNYNEFGDLPSSFYTRVSYGFGYLHKGQTIINGISANETDVYNSTNHSLGVALGNTHRLKRWVVDYGIYGQFGLSIIHRQQPTDYNHLLGVGAYVGLRYVF